MDDGQEHRAELARNELARFMAMDKPTPIRDVRRKAKVACLPDRALAVFMAVSRMRYKPTFGQLQKQCGMSSSTLADALNHLDRHGWLIRTTAGRGHVYEPRLGEPCTCRPGRGKAMTTAERVARHRSRKRAQDVTLNRSNEGGLQAPDVTLNRSVEDEGCNTGERYKAQVTGRFPPIGVAAAPEPPKPLATVHQLAERRLRYGETVTDGEPCPDCGDPILVTRDGVRFGLDLTRHAENLGRVRAAAKRRTDMPSPPGNEGDPGHGGGVGPERAQAQSGPTPDWRRWPPGSIGEQANEKESK